MMKVVAAAAFLAAQWQPAHAQTMLGSIPEEFRTIGLSRRLIQSLRLESLSSDLIVFVFLLGFLVVTVAAPQEPLSVASFRCPVALQPSTRQLARDACGKFELRLFEPKSPLPGNGILRAETKSR